jgi:hypothetical protein
MIATVNPITMCMKLLLAVAALALAWWTGVVGVQFALQFFRDGALAAFLGGLAMSGVAGAAGMALGRWWAPALIGVQAAGFFIWLLFFGRFPNGPLPFGLVAMMVVSVALVIWDRRRLSGQPR